MNWARLILDGLMGSLLFNAVAILGFLLVPQAYSTMFPKEIKQAAAPYVDRKDVRTVSLILYPVSGAVHLVGYQFPSCGHIRLLESVLDRLCGDDAGEHYRFPDP